MNGAFGGDSRRGRIGWRRLALAGLLGWLVASGLARAEDWESDLQYEAKLRISQLILGLDAPYLLRREKVEELATRGLGRNAEFTLHVLNDALNYGNDQIREGLVDVLARIGDPRSVSELAVQMRHEDFIDVRLRIMRALPAFIVQDSLKVRYELLEMAEQENYSLTQRAKSIIRREPFRTATGEFDPAQDHLRRAIETALAGQLDPIGAIIEDLGSKQLDVRAQRTLLRFCSRPLGRSREEWAENWKSLQSTFISVYQDEVEAAQVAACKVLANFGAEGTEEEIARLRQMTRRERPALIEAALGAVAELTRVVQARREEAALALTRARADAGRSAEVAYRERRLKGTARLIDLARELGRQMLAREEPGLRVAAYDCLGAGRDQESVEIIRRRLVQGQEPMEVQFYIARALGEIGSPEAVKLLSVLADDRGTGVDVQTRREEQRLMIEAFAALGRVAAAFGRPEARQAFAEILRRLEDDRPLPGATDPSQQVRRLALDQLQRLTGVGEENWNTPVWSRRYQDLSRRQGLLKSGRGD